MTQQEAHVLVGLALDLAAIGAQLMTLGDLVKGAEAKLGYLVEKRAPAHVVQDVSGDVQIAQD